jgi:hypothetical protein
MESLRPEGKKQESLRPGREKTGIFKTWKGKNRNLYVPEGKKQESLRPGRKKAGIFKTWKGKSRNL